MTEVTRILSLPQVLQDLISEYNVNHRPQMYPVHRQIMKINHASRMQHVFREMAQTIDRYGADSCDTCEDLIDNYEHVLEIHGYSYLYCSAWCMQDSVYFLRKQMKRDTRNQSKIECLK